VGLESVGELFERTGGRDCLQLTLALELHLPVGHVVREQQRSIWPRCQHLRDDRRACEVSRTRSDLQIDLVALSEVPPRRDHGAVTVVVTRRRVEQAVIRPEQIAGLVVLIGLDRLDERHEVRRQLAKACRDHLAATLPVAANPPQVLQDDTHLQVTLVNAVGFAHSDADSS
jgi:hypothetical protein